MFTESLTIWTLHVLALSFAGALIYGFIFGTISAEAFLGIASSVISYFTARKV